MAEKDSMQELLVAGGVSVRCLDHQLAHPPFAVPTTNTKGQVAFATGCVRCATITLWPTLASWLLILTASNVKYLRFTIYPRVPTRLRTAHLFSFPKGQDASWPLQSSCVLALMISQEHGASFRAAFWFRRRSPKLRSGDAPFSHTARYDGRHQHG